MPAASAVSDESSGSGGSRDIYRDKSGSGSWSYSHPGSVGGLGGLSVTDGGEPTEGNGRGKENEAQQRPDVSDGESDAYRDSGLVPIHPLPPPSTSTRDSTPRTSSRRKEPSSSNPSSRSSSSSHLQHHHQHQHLSQSREAGPQQQQQPQQPLQPAGTADCADDCEDCQNNVMCLPRNCLPDPQGCMPDLGAMCGVGELAQAWEEGFGGAND
eukprot:CAMPEP_0197445100 /NCGR_PEP_ID=MMETSP1175-20131217/10402_1 /TAXON_ID=1003142 /ORGANISM="Triceratium dubium, Strain CCMP147" /LENGTH=211 /DNA_ID=CAMNT_0042976005 /DNA_START=1 /DNA_END=633 /DNA_ORIENTATION=+